MNNHPGRNPFFAWLLLGGFFTAMASALLPIRPILAVILEISSIRVRRVAVLLPFRLLANGLSFALSVMLIPLSATVLFGVGSLVDGLSEICASTAVYGEVYSFTFHDGSLSETVCWLHASRVKFEWAGSLSLVRFLRPFYQYVF